MKLLACLVVLTIGVVVNAEDGDGRIVNGQRIHIKQAPFMIQIRNNGEMHCGGSLIKPNVVLTAAHCIVGQDTSTLRAVYGATSVRELGIQRTIKSYCIHSDYTKNTKYSDMALLQLNEAIPNCRTVPLCSRELNTDDTLRVYGWGQLAESGAMPTDLQTVTVPVRSFADCQTEFGRYVKQDMFCASGRSQVGSCLGDSGGPALSNDGEVCGLVAFAYRCGKVGYMGAFTSVRSVKPMIEKCMKAFK